MTKQPPADKAMPEGRWFWRRLYIFVTSALSWGLLLTVVRRSLPADLPRIAEGLMGLLALVLVVYLVAPSAQQIVAVVAELRLRLGGRR